MFYVISTFAHKHFLTKLAEKMVNNVSIV